MYYEGYEKFCRILYLQLPVDCAHRARCVIVAEDSPHMTVVGMAEGKEGLCRK